MVHQTYNWKNAKGQKIFGQSWVPQITARAVICNVHGQGEHSSRYDHVAAFFVQHNIAFFTVDLVGHGQSDGARGHINKFSEYIENLELMHDEAVKMYPDLPLFIYGHSMGGNIALNHAFYTSEKIKGYIITSPWIRLAFEPPAWKVALGKTVKSFIPGLQQPTGLNPEKISRDPVEVKKYSDDPLNHDKISAAGFFEILTNGKNILLQADKLRFPVLLMHGTADGLTSHIASREFAELRKDLVTYIEFEGLYHEMHHEKERQLIFDAMLQWIEIHLND